MQLKKLFAVGLTAIMIDSLLVGCSRNKTESNNNVYKIGMIADIGGVNDESFNQSTWEGLQQAQEKYGKDKVEVKYVESNQEADYTTNIETFVDEDLDLIIGVGYKMADALEEAANPDAEITVRCANSFNDSALGKSIANQMHKDGVDVIFTAASGVGTETIEAARENNKMAIGVDVAQSSLAPNNIITSTMKNIDVSIVDLVGTMVDGSYKGGQVIVNTLASGGVGLSDTTSNGCT